MLPCFFLELETPLTSKSLRIPAAERLCRLLEVLGEPGCRVDGGTAEALGMGSFEEGGIGRQQLAC